MLGEASARVSAWGPPPLSGGAGGWGEGLFQGLVQPVIWGGGVSSSLAQPIPSNLGHHFIRMSCRGRGSASGGPLGTVGGPPQWGPVMSSPTPPAGTLGSLADGNSSLLSPWQSSGSPLWKEVIFLYFAKSSPSHFQGSGLLPGAVLAARGLAPWRSKPPPPAPRPLLHGECELGLWLGFSTGEAEISMEGPGTW